MIEYKAEHLILGRGLRYRARTIDFAIDQLVDTIAEKISEDGRTLVGGIQFSRSTNRVGTVKLVARAVAQ